MQNEANSSSVPSRPWDHRLHLRARRSGRSTPLAARNSGKSMKFVPTAFTWTPVRGDLGRDVAQPAWSRPRVPRSTAARPASGAPPSGARDQRAPGPRPPRPSRAPRRGGSGTALPDIRAPLAGEVLRGGVHEASGHDRFPRRRLRRRRRPKRVDRRVDEPFRRLRVADVPAPGTDSTVAPCARSSSTGDEGGVAERERVVARGSSRYGRDPVRR